MAPCRRGEGRSPRQVAGGDTLHRPPHAARALYTHTFALTHALPRSLSAACRFGDCHRSGGVVVVRGTQDGVRSVSRKGLRDRPSSPSLRSRSFWISSSSIASSGGDAASFAGVPCSSSPSSSCRKPSFPRIRPVLPPDLDWPRTRRLVPRPPSRTPFYGGVCGCEPKVSGDSRLKFAVAGRPFWLMAFCQDFSQANNKIYPKRKNVGWTSRACGKALKQSGSHFLCERSS